VNVTLILQKRLDDGFERIELAISDLADDSANTATPVIAQLRIQDEREEVIANLSRLGCQSSVLGSEDEATAATLDALQKRLVKLERQQKRSADEFAALDEEQQRLHPFFRFLQTNRGLQDDLMQLQGVSAESHSLVSSTADSCRTFYAAFKVYMISYLLKTKLLSDEVLLDKSGDIPRRMAGGLTAVFEIIAEVVPAVGGAIGATGKALVYLVETSLGLREDQIKEKNEAKLVASRDTFVTAFSVSEAEYLAQIIALTVTKCYELQLRKLTPEACKDVAKAAITRIAVSLGAALEETPNSTGLVLPGSASATTSKTSSAASMQAVGAAVDRLCHLMLRALRMPYVERNVLKFWSKVKFATRQPKLYGKYWNVEGIFGKSGILVLRSAPDLPVASASSTAQPLAADAESKHALPLSTHAGLATALPSPACSGISLVAAPLITRALQSAFSLNVSLALDMSASCSQLCSAYGRALVLRVKTFETLRRQGEIELWCSHPDGSDDDRCRPGKYGYSLGTVALAQLCGLQRVSTAGNDGSAGRVFWAWCQGDQPI